MVSVSIVPATRGSRRSAATFGACGGVPSTSSLPFQQEPDRNHAGRAVERRVAQAQQVLGVEQLLREGVVEHAADASVMGLLPSTPAP